MANEITIHTFAQVTSTNDTAKALAEQGAPHGAVVLAQSQTQGRGRGTNRWVSAPEGGLYMSVILRRYGLAPGLLPLAAALGLTAAVNAAVGGGAYIKWPNDLLLNRKKAGGILIEQTAGFAVVGLGVNVNNRAFPPELAQTATSLFLERGVEADIPALARNIALALESWLAADSQRLLQAYAALCVNIGQRVRTEGTFAIEGLATGIAQDGGLIIQKDDGTQETVYVGAVHL